MRYYSRRKNSEMSEKKIKIAPYGSWKSPLSSAIVCQSSPSFGELHGDPKDPGVVYWSELHPEENGRVIVFSKAVSDTKAIQWTPSGFSCKSRVHEYGGGSFFVYNKILFFVNDSDQQIYSQHSATDTPTLVTPGHEKHRYADGDHFPNKKQFVCICEDHTSIASKGEPENSLVLIDPVGKVEHSLVTGSDFYASPRISPDGSKLLWMEWDHPNMPWENTRIVVADLLTNAVDSSSFVYVSCKEGVNAQHPRWGANGQIFFINDETNWWNIYSWDNTSKQSKNLLPKEFEFGHPLWQLGREYFAVNSQGNQIITKFEKGLLILDAQSGLIKSIPIGENIISDVILCPSDERVFAISHNSTSPSSIITVHMETQEITTLSFANTPVIDPGYLSKPGRISFPTDNGNAVAYGNFYPPKNKDFKGPSGACPPLLVQVHGGPTSQTRLSLDLRKQYFTSRGFAILDVDYRGSTGFGKKYREALNGKWGIHDVEDCCSGALYLVNELRLVNPDGLFIDGGSAGGYTTLACLTFRNIFKAGVSYYGVSDIELLLKETHKFESRYLHSLIAPYPTKRQVYIDRSPLYHIDNLNVAVAFFHGGLDKVVPPNQAEMMYKAISAKGLPCAYELFPDEYHGFVKAENKQKALDGEFFFLTQMLGVEAADQGIEIPIQNLKK